MLGTKHFQYKVPSYEFSPEVCHGQTQAETKSLLKSFRVESGKSRQTMLKHPTIEDILAVTLTNMRRIPCSRSNCSSKLVNNVHKETDRVMLKHALPVRTVVSTT